MVIIHCGDLIHKGPHTGPILQNVNKLIQNNPGQWVQLLGNHEFQHIPGAPVFWRCYCSTESIQIINHWYAQKLATVAFGVDNITPPNLEVSATPEMRTNTSSWVFTHAGITHDWWVLAGCPTTAKELADSLNNFPTRAITAPGEILNTPVNYHHPPGPVWAVGSTEVFNSWFLAPQPPVFNQIYGHTTSYLFPQNRWMSTGKWLKPFRDATKLNPETRAVITNLGDNQLMVGIDPGFSKTADIKEQPFLTLQGTSF